MDPILICKYSGTATLTIEDGGELEVEIVTVYVAKSRKDDIDRNDTLRREVTAAIASVLPTEPT